MVVVVHEHVADEITEAYVNVAVARIVMMWRWAGILQVA